MDRKLFQAATDGETEVFREKVSELQLLLTPERNTVLHVHIITTSRTTNQTTTFVEGILDLCPTLLMQTNAREETPLLMAARYDHHHIVDFLIERAKLSQPQDLEEDISSVQTMIRMKNEEEDTALHEAARFGHLEVVQILTREDPHFSYSANKAGETPLYIAVQCRHQDLVKEILNNCSSPATSGPNGRTALHAASTNIGITKMLLDKVDYLTKQADDDGFIPLHYVACFDSSNVVEITKMLLENNESSAYIKNKKGMTALHIAAYNECYGDKIMKEILASCPDSYEQVDNEGRNVLHHAVSTTCLSNVNFILEHASLIGGHYLLNRKDKEGNTPLLHMAATSSWNLPILKSLLSHPKVNRMSLTKQNNNIRDVYMIQFKQYEVRMLDLFNKYSIEPSVGKHILELELNRENIKYVQKEVITKMKESSLVTSTLIATVTFAAGFTMPGGYISDEVGHRQQGSAVLRNNTAFQAFIITNTMAMLLSATSVFLNIFLNISFVEGVNDHRKWNYYKVCMSLTIYALVLMMIAFVTGTYAVLSLSAPLAITTCFIGSLFFVITFYIIMHK
ncbi:protein ACCELERATED CELL DEATH 6-like isoform X2 [Humulus lupulus]|nr:protein ACCELERATED CELL DEATH 6-like isoform X2 [Humulus lupulus]XP_062119782.1 protein ACCELERATED CELL DEATH 6-like isoform X2 [Humulus lupulus]XP_062119787.1 protein ACCELERATED CELL DEATH 6-like isoform X2 [Humulus lupulus]XP_062119789.1 protein ACCELERATED CELL DEATH 6-like isoform X2 [Humulus lupulus]